MSIALVHQVLCGKLVLAASSWPFVVPIVLPVVAALFFLAVRFADNSRQRITNMLFGLLGSLAASLVLRYVVDVSENRWLIEGQWRLVVAPVTLTIGAVFGISVSITLKTIQLSRKQWTSSHRSSDSSQGIAIQRQSEGESEGRQDGEDVEQR